MYYLAFWGPYVVATRMRPDGPVTLLLAAAVCRRGMCWAVKMVRMTIIFMSKPRRRVWTTVLPERGGYPHKKRAFSRYWAPYATAGG